MVWPSPALVWRRSRRIPSVYDITTNQCRTRFENTHSICWRIPTRLPIGQCESSIGSLVRQIGNPRIRDDTYQKLLCWVVQAFLPACTAPGLVHVIRNYGSRVLSRIVIAIIKHKTIGVAAYAYCPRLRRNYVKQKKKNDKNFNNKTNSRFHLPCSARRRRGETDRVRPVRLSWTGGGGGIIKINDGDRAWLYSRPSRRRATARSNFSPRHPCPVRPPRFRARSLRVCVLILLKISCSVQHNTAAARPDTIIINGTSCAHVWTGIIHIYRCVRCTQIVRVCV